MARRVARVAAEITDRPMELELLVNWQCLTWLDLLAVLICFLLLQRMLEQQQALLIWLQCSLKE